MVFHAEPLLFDQYWQNGIAYIRDIGLDDIRELLRRYSALGPLPGILLPLAEAFLPFLPLVVFVVANATAYGMWAGFLLSWIGVSVGSFLVFLLARRFAGRFGERIRKRSPKMERFFSWIENKGFTPIFVLSCFPFSPSALINIASGMSKIGLHTFLTAILLGKSVMIFTLSFLGHDLQALVDHPWRIAAALIVLFLLWMVGKKLESRYTED
ncbi:MULTISPECIES: TVP38/TMEM64 family protein [Cohnella]|uniref:TVP38/TMEM64 family protein n=1 Tax=Cohnella TaxID=329857 RepID=UPI0009B9C75E|nr:MULTISPECIES: TVP38/TMEM64 family protein [Cohnella]MBN2981997.1 TVP38/TMEM64 family protein [Cohnella algarum]